MKILIGTGTCGLASGAGEVMDAARTWARLREENITIAGTGCVGFCQAEPILDVVTGEGNRVSFGQVQPDAVPGLLEPAARGSFDQNGLIGQYRNGARPLPGLPFIEEHPYFKKQVKFVLRNCGVIQPTDLPEYTGRGGLRGLERALSMTPEQVIDEITRSGLRGRGGGGFPTGKKWRFAFQEDAERKLVICNADEGDPGAFMDRAL
ncbi:MAG: NADH-quinone oxidoreductase subunit F, partial [Spirochaetota bacterium]